MKMKSFIRDLHAIAKAHASGDGNLLQTPSGKIKQDTLFERAYGLGKLILAKIHGKSYELKEINLEDAKNEVKNRFYNQVDFFSAPSNLNDSQKEIIKVNAELLIETLVSTKNEGFLKNPKTAFSKKNDKHSPTDKQISVSIELISEDKKESQEKEKIYAAEKQSALIFEYLGAMYSSPDSLNYSNKFKIQSKLFDEKYEALNKKGKEQTQGQLTQAIGIKSTASLAADLMENLGESMNNAIVLAQLMHRKELKDLSDENIKYEIAKIFADQYLSKDAAKMDEKTFSAKLSETKNVPQLRKFSEECLELLNHLKLGEQNERPRLSTLIALRLQNEKKSPDIVEVQKYYADAWSICSSYDAKAFHENLHRGIYDQSTAESLIEELKKSTRNRFQ